MEVLVKSEMPASAGLGSSAAYCTCVSASLLLLTGAIPVPTDTIKQLPQPWNQPTYTQLINKWAFEAEKVIHGKPSGIDNSVSTYGKI